MSLRASLLIGSVALNATLLAAFVVRPSLAPPGVRDVFQRGASVSSASSASASDSSARETATKAKTKISDEQRATERRAQLWAALKTDDLRSLVARLRAAGFSPAAIRAVLDAQIEAQFAPRFKAINRANEETPYWKPDPTFVGNSKFYEDINQIYRDRTRLMRDLLGADALAGYVADTAAAQRRQYGNLSQAKIDLVQRVSDDYAEMIGQVRVAMQGVTLPEDQEKIALLEREKRADLAAILSPEELAEYEMRTSTVTNRLRSAFSIMDVSEQEFRTIYGIYQPFADKLYPTVAGTYTSEMVEQRREATKLVNDQLKAALGADRYAAFQRASNSEFQQLYRSGQSDNLPMETLVRAFDVRTATADASTRIMNDRALSNDEKRTQLQNLAQSARTQLLSTLGPTVGPAYTDRTQWLIYVQGGGSFSITPEGGLSYRQLPRTPAPGAVTPTR